MKQDSRPWIYSNYWLQFILDNFSTIEEVIASDSSIRIFDYVDHYLVSDKYGNAATIEFIDGKRVVHYGNDLPVKALSNSSYSKALDAYKASSQEVNLETIISKQGSSIGRFIIAADRIKKFQPSDFQTTISTAFEILDAVSGQKTNGSATRWSIVFDTKNLKVYFKTIVNSKIRQINLKELDFSCRATVKMIDINEPLEGDITHRMKEYSTDLHFKHALQAFKKWGSNPVPEELLKQIQFLDNFLCSCF
jgi:choloylglycine hydrolase